MDNPFNIFNICPKCKIKKHAYCCSDCGVIISIAKCGDGYIVDFFDVRNNYKYTFQTEYGILEEKITSNFIIKEFVSFQEVFDCLVKYYSNLEFV